MEFRVAHTWDGSPVQHEPARLRLRPGRAGVLLEVTAPLFRDPPAPAGAPGQPFSGLWDYEVVEAFFLNDLTEQYLEVELCPHGQHLVLLLSGRRNVWKAGDGLGRRSSPSLELLSPGCEQVQRLRHPRVGGWKALRGAVPGASAGPAAGTDGRLPPPGVLPASQFHRAARGGVEAAGIRPVACGVDGHAVAPSLPPTRRPVHSQSSRAAPAGQRANQRERDVR